MDAVHQSGVRRTDVFAGWAGFIVVDECWASGRRVTTKDKTYQQDEGSALVSGTHWLILLAEDEQATETDHTVCPRTLAAATPQSLQVAHCSSKAISGQLANILTCSANYDTYRPLITALASDPLSCRTQRRK